MRGGFDLHVLGSVGSALVLLFAESGIVLPCMVLHGMLLGSRKARRKCWFLMSSIVHKVAFVETFVRRFCVFGQSKACCIRLAGRGCMLIMLSRVARLRAFKVSGFISICCVVNMFLVQIEAQESIVQNVAGLKNWWLKKLLVSICRIQRVALWWKTSDFKASRFHLLLVKESGKKMWYYFRAPVLV